MRKKYSRKGQLWISAVLYIALGVVAITLVLSAGLPLINKMKDRNTVLQAKEMINVIDTAINDVRKEGPGSRRYLSPVILKGGELVIDNDVNKIKWKLRTSNVMVEPCSLQGTKYLQNDAGVLDYCDGGGNVLREGSLYYYQTTTIVKDEYDVRAEVVYNNINLDTNNNNPLKGKYSFSIENYGILSGDKQTINIDVT